MTPKRKKPVTTTGHGYVVPPSTPEKAGQASSRKSHRSHNTAPREEGAMNSNAASASAISLPTPVKMEHTPRSRPREKPTQSVLQLRVKKDIVIPKKEPPRKAAAAATKSKKNPKDVCTGTKRKRSSGELAMVLYQGTGASSSAVVPVGGGGKRKRPKLPVRGLDIETRRAYDALIKWEERTGEDFEGVDIGSGPKWEEIRRQYAQKADEFIFEMEDLFGNFLQLFVVFRMMN